MNLRSLLRRDNSEDLPTLPAAGPDDSGSDRVDEQLERLLTPRELDMVREHRL